MNIWQRIHQFLGRPKIKSIQYSPNLVESSVQFGARVRILSDPVTDERGFAGKVGEVYGQTTPSVTNPVVIGTPLKDYAVSVFFEDSQEQHWFPEHLVELLDHNPGATIRLDGVDKEWVRNAHGGWDERPISK